jgi:hypothetical protein
MTAFTYVFSVSPSIILNGRPSLGLSWTTRRQEQARLSSHLAAMLSSSSISASGAVTPGEWLASISK